MRELAYLEPVLAEQVIADSVQQGFTAYMATERNRIYKPGQKPNYSPPKKKLMSRNTKFVVRKQGYHPRKGQLSLKHRKYDVVELKKRTKSSKCGQKGHWSTDPGCRHNRNSKPEGHRTQEEPEAPPALKPVASMAIAAPERSSLRGSTTPASD